MLDLIVELLRQGVLTAGAVLAMPLLAGLGVAVLVAALQTITSLHDPTIATIPRLVAIGGTLALLTPWILSKLVEMASAMLTINGALATGG